MAWQSTCDFTALLLLLAGPQLRVLHTFLSLTPQFHITLHHSMLAAEDTPREDSAASLLPGTGGPSREDKEGGVLSQGGKQMVSHDRYQHRDSGVAGRYSPAPVSPQADTFTIYLSRLPVLPHKPIALRVQGKLFFASRPDQLANGDEAGEVTTVVELPPLMRDEEVEVEVLVAARDIQRRLHLHLAGGSHLLVDWEAEGGREKEAYVATFA